MEKKVIDRLANNFKKHFGLEPENYFASPGRLEIIGNHVDHNGGLALVASASIFINASVSKANDIQIFSEGHGLFNCQAIDSLPNEKDYSSTISLIKGIVHGFIARGYKVGGFKAYCFSNVLEGSGISSSAAFEMLISEILNSLYNNSSIDKITLVKISQEAEKDYFGKPCGLLDQIGSAFGGISLVNFKDQANPTVSNVSFPFDLKILLVNPGGSHVGLTSYYASIPNQMHKVAKAMGGNNLCDFTEDEFNDFIAKNPKMFTEEEINRCIHFFEENKRVNKAFEAIVNNDKETFLKTVNESGYSSSHILCNTLVPGRYENSPERALEIARKIAPNSGHRIHGGGFMGTIISFCLTSEYDGLVKEMKKVFGENAVQEVSISSIGSSLVK